MRIEQEQRPKRVIVTKTDEKEVVDVYITDDGKRFYDKAEAERHERKLAVPKKDFSVEFEGNYGVLYYFKNQEDMKACGCGGLYKEIVAHNYNLPGWFLVQEEHGYMGSSQYLFPLSKVKEELQRALNNLPEE